MAIAVRTARSRRRPALGTLAVPVVPALTAIVALSALVRAVAGWLRATPVYFADEYLYAEMARTLVEGGRPLVRDHAASFPALLQPIVTAPLWLLPQVEDAYRATQLLGAVAMSLAAVPVYLLARRIGVGTRAALAVSAFSLALPDLLYASWVVAEPLAYPLALAAVLAGTVALARPSLRVQLAFVGLAGLAGLARAQFVVLPLCFLAAALLLGLVERRLRSVLREQAPVAAMLALPVAAAAAMGPERVLGLYAGVLDQRADPFALLERIGANALVLAYASGWVLVPGALLGLALGLVRPLSREERAFAALAVFTTAALLGEASLFGAVEQVQERYAFYALPLVAIAFAAYAGRGWPLRLHHALLAAALVTVSAQVPLAGFAAADGKAHSVFLFAVSRVEQTLGGAGNGSLALAAAVALASLAVVAASRRPTVATPLALALAITASGAAWVGAATLDRRTAAGHRADFLPADPSWVDRAGLGSVTLLRSPDGGRTETLEQLFWNPSIDRVALLPGAEQLDHYLSPEVTVGRDGSLSTGGRPLAGPLLVDRYGATVRLTGATPVASSRSFTLWRPDGRPRLALYAPGRYADGWLGGSGSFTLWPEPGQSTLAGTLRFRIEAPAEVENLTLRIGAGGDRPQELRLAGGEAATVTVPVCSRGPWRGGFAAAPLGFAGPRVVSARTGALSFRPDPAACDGVPVQGGPAVATTRV